MNHPAHSSATSPDASIPSLPVRIAQVFAAPGTLFDALRQRPAWVGAVVGLVVVGAAAQLLSPLLIPEEVRRAMIENQMIAPGTDPAAAEQQVAFWLNTGPMVGAGAAVVITPIITALIAGLLLLAFNVILGGEATFRQLFSACAHASYVNLAGVLVGLGLMMLGSETPILSPGLFLPEVEGFIGRFLNGINVFAVWTCGVLGVAVSRIYPGRSVAAGTTYLLVLYLLFAAAGAAAGGLGG